MIYNPYTKESHQWIEFKVFQSAKRQEFLSIIMYILYTYSPTKKNKVQFKHGQSRSRYFKECTLYCHIFFKTKIKKIKKHHIINKNIENKTYACTCIKIDKRCRLGNASNNCFCVKTQINKAYGPHVKFDICTFGTHPWHVCMSVCDYL